MTDRHSKQTLRLATLLTAGVLSLLALGLTAGAETLGSERVLGTTVQNDSPASLAFSSPESEQAQNFLDRINQLRAERGAAPLGADIELQITASAWTTHMSQTGDLQHADDLSVGVSSDWRKLGENVGVAPVNQLDELFEAFVASPTHLANLVDPSFDMIGIGVVHADGQIWMTQRFMDLSPEANGVVLG